jgi:hypothetical protein
MGVLGRAWACMGVRGRAWACTGTRNMHRNQEPTRREERVSIMRMMAAALKEGHGSFSWAVLLLLHPVNPGLVGLVPLFTCQPSTQDPKDQPPSGTQQWDGGSVLQRLQPLHRWLPMRDCLGRTQDQVLQVRGNHGSEHALDLRDLCRWCLLLACTRKHCTGWFASTDKLEISCARMPAFDADALRAPAAWQAVRVLRRTCEG